MLYLEVFAVFIQKKKYFQWYVSLFFVNISLKIKFYDNCLKYTFHLFMKIIPLFFVPVALLRSSDQQALILEPVKTKREKNAEFRTKTNICTWFI